MSMRSSRIFTLSEAPESRYSSSLSWIPVGVRTRNTTSAAPNRVPNERHSQRGMMVATSLLLG